MSSPNLAIPHLASNQSNKYITVNTAIDSLDEALCQLLSQAMTDADYTFASASALGNMAFKMTGTLTAARNVILPTNEKLYMFKNATTGGFKITLKTSAGTGIDVASGSGYVLLYCDGTNIVAPAVSASGLSLEVNGTANGSQSLLNLKSGSNITVTDDGSGGITVAASSGTTTGGVSSKTADYTAASGDNATLLSFNSASAHTLTLPAAIPSSTWFIFVKNIGTGTLTIARNGFTIDGRSSNLTLVQGEATIIMTDNSNWLTSAGRTRDIIVFAPGVGSNSQKLLRVKMPRAVIFPASAPNAFGAASANATGSTTYTFLKNGTSFATAVFSASGSTAAFTQAADAVFAPGDLLEIDGPATADATLADVSLSFPGIGF